MGGRPGQQPVPGVDDGAQVPRVPRADRRRARAWPARPVDRTVAATLDRRRAAWSGPSSWSSSPTPAGRARCTSPRKIATPSRNLPRAMIGGVLAVIVIYVLVNVALLAILPVSRARGRQAAGLGGGRAPARHRSAGQVITVLSIVSLAPLLNAIMMIGTRILFALGRDRLFWSRTADVNAGGTPGIATLVTTIVAVILIVTGTFQRLVAMASFFLALNYAISCVALVALRRREPSHDAAVPRLGIPVVGRDRGGRRAGVPGQRACWKTPPRRSPRSRVLAARPGRPRGGAHATGRVEVLINVVVAHSVVGPATTGSPAKSPEPDGRGTWNAGCCLTAACCAPSSLPLPRPPSSSPAVPPVGPGLASQSPSPPRRSPTRQRSRRSTCCRSISRCGARRDYNGDLDQRADR